MYSVSFMLEKGIYFCIQDLQNHGVGSFLRPLYVFLQMLLQGICIHPLHASQHTTSLLMATGFSHTEHGKLTIR